MNPNNEYFPYPFISSLTDDYNDKKFEVTTSSSEDMEKWIFNSTVTLEDDALKKLVDVKFFLVANENLTLSSNNFHADYMQNIFQREKGDILGEATSFDFDPQDD